MGYRLIGEVIWFNKCNVTYHISLYRNQLTLELYRYINYIEAKSSDSQ